MVRIENTPVSLRFASHSDAKEILDIYSPCVQETAFTFETDAPSIEGMQDKISKISRKYPWLVAEKSGQVIGYAYASQHRERPAYRWSVEVSVYVHSAHQRQGIAERLYRQLIVMLRRQGYYNAYAGITLPNQPSVALHERCGFKYLGTYKSVGYKIGRWHDVGWWELSLNCPSQTPSEPTPCSQSDIRATFAPTSPPSPKI